MNLPWRLFFLDSIRAGHLPLLNPYVGCGFPQFAEGQTGALFPLNYIALMFTSDGWILFGPLILTIALGGFGFYLFLRQLKRSIPASLIASFAFTFSAFFTCHLSHVALASAAALLPYLFLGLMLTYRGRWVGPPLIALATALILTAGHPQGAFIEFVAALAYFIFLLTQPAPRRWLWPILAVLGGVAGILVAMPQLLPTYGFWLFSNRAAYPAAEAVTYSYKPYMLFTLLFPFLFGVDSVTGRGNYFGPQNFVEMSAYFSFVGTAFVVIGLFRLKRVRAWVVREEAAHITFFLVLAAISILLAFGKYGGIYYILAHIPGVSAFRVPARFMLDAVFALSAFFAFVWDYETHIFDSKRWKTALLIILVAWPLLRSFTTEGLLRQFYMSGPDERLLHGNLEFWMGVVIAALVIVAYKVWPWKRVLQAAFIVLVVWDLQLFYATYNHVVPMTEAYRGSPRLLMECFPASKNPPYRVAQMPGSPWEDESLLSPDLSSISETESASFKGPLLSPFLVDLYKDVSPTSSFWSAAGVKYLMERDTRPFVPLARFAKKAVTIPFPAQHYRLHHTYRVADSPDPLVKPVVGGGLDPSQTVVLTQADAAGVVLKPASKTVGAASASSSESVAVTKYEPSEREVSVTSATPAILATTDAFYPGWRAYVDGSPAGILRVNWAFMGVAVPEGTHTVRFAYSEPSLPLAKRLSIVGLAAFIIIAIIGIVLEVAGAAPREARKA